MLGTTAAVAAAGATGVAGGVALTRAARSARPRLRREPAGAPAPATANKYEVKPGELDEYYVFFSSGQTGELRIVGLPVDARADARARVQPRQRDRVGADQREPQDPDRGLTPENREFLKDKGGIYTNGDLHHPASVLHRRHL